MVEEGKSAPSFSLMDDQGKKISLKDFKGKRVILYFYPKDNTPGCTTEACGFRDEFSALRKKKALVLGVSPDSIASHKKFKEKYDLPFPLLSDPDHKVAQKYGAWGTKKMYGREFMGIIRSTFVIDKQGKIEKVYDKVRVKGHAENILESL